MPSEYGAEYIEASGNMEDAIQTYIKKCYALQIDPETGLVNAIYDASGGLIDLGVQ